MTTHEPDQVTTHDHPTEPLTVAEVSATFGVSVSTVRRLLAENKLPNASKRKGPKGDEWVIPPADMATLGYRFTGPQAKGDRTGHDPVADAVGALVEEQRADYETKLAEQQQHHDELVAALKGQHQAEVERHRAEVEQLTERADYERQLREAAETQATLAATLAQQVREDLVLERRRVAELESASAKRRWFRKGSKPAGQTEQT